MKALPNQTVVSKVAQLLKITRILAVVTPLACGMGSISHAAQFYISNVIEGPGTPGAPGDTLYADWNNVPINGAVVTMGYFPANFDVLGHLNDRNELIANFTVRASALTGGMSVTLGGAYPGYVESWVPIEIITGTNPLIGRAIYSLVGNASTLAASTKIILIRVGNISDDVPIEEVYESNPKNRTPLLGSVGTYQGNLLGWASDETYGTVRFNWIPRALLSATPAPTGGTISGFGFYEDGQIAVVTASAAPGYIFSGWTGAASGAVNPLSVTMNADKTIGATFGPDTADSDGDGISNFDEIVTYGSDPNDANSIPGDADGDELADTWEVANFGNIAAQTGAADADGDGYTNDAEETAGSNPAAVASTPLDIDGDGLFDAWEIANFGNVAAQIGTGDADADGYPNEAEETSGSNPNLTASTPLDVDGDGLADAWEVAYFGNIVDQNGSGDPDNDGNSNEVEETAGSSPNNSLSIPSDQDADGLLDSWEVVYFANTTAQSATDDPDNDGFTNLQEQAGGTNPANSDTDGDGLTDSEEVNLTQTNPALSDSDGDGISDAYEDRDGDGLDNLIEVRTYGTSPALADSDGDGLSDAYELGLGRYSVVFDILNWSAAKLDAESKGGTLATIANAAEWNLATQSIGEDALWDVNGLWIGTTDTTVEGSWIWITGEPVTFSDWAAGEPNNLNDSDYAAVAGDLGGEIGKWYDFRASTARDGYILESGYATSPTDMDSDDDGLNDGQERTSGSNPLLADTDGDGLTDAEEVDLTHTNPSMDDTDGNGISDANDDQDNDGLTNLAELRTHLTNPAQADSDGDGLSDREEITRTLTNPNLADTDSDGLNDGLEVNTYGCDPLSQDTDADGLTDGDEVARGSNPKGTDTDGDGLTDREEVMTHGTNPLVKDTDGDGFDDMFEVNAGFSPNSAASTPDAVASIRAAVEFRFNAANGISYRIEASTNLSTWNTVETDVIGEGGVVTRFYSTETQPTRYFRARKN